MASFWTDFVWSLKQYKELYPSFFGGASWTSTEVDFGSSKPVYSASFTITDADCAADSKVTVLSSGAAATGRAVGDDLWDAIMYSAVPAAGSFTVYAFASPGPVVGKRSILYSIS
jgi:hypothetical protein